MKERPCPPLRPSPTQTIGALHVVDHDDRGSIYGSLDILRDKTGLAPACPTEVDPG